MTKKVKGTVSLPYVFYHEVNVTALVDDDADDDDIEQALIDEAVDRCERPYEDSTGGITVVDGSIDFNEDVTEGPMNLNCEVTHVVKVDP